MLPVVTRTLAEHKPVKHQSGRIRREQSSVATTCKTVPFFGVVLLLLTTPVDTFIFTKAGEIDSQSLVRPEWTD